MKLSELYRRYFPLLIVLAALSAIQLHGQDPTPMSNWSFVTIDGKSTPKRYVISNESFHVGASNNEPIQTNFIFLPLNGNGHVTARISTSNAPAIQSGLMIRDSLSNEAKYAWMCLTSNNAVAFERRLEPKENAIRTLGTNISNVRHLRVVREGNAFSGFYSIDSTNWVQISADTIEMGNEALAGFASVGGETVFDQVRVTSASLVGPRQDARFIAPTNILLTPNITTTPGERPRSVEFFSGFNKIGEIIQPPYVFDWTNALAGDHSLTAKITDANGAEFFTEPVHCEIALPPPQVKFVGVDEVTRGNWRGKYGAEGFAIPNNRTNLPEYVEWIPIGFRRHIWVNSTGEERCLMLVDSEKRIASSWYHSKQLEFNLILSDGNPHRFAIYLLDWDRKDRSTLVEVINPFSKTVLDSRTVSSFSNGKYLMWSFVGHVRIRITAIKGNASISGLFFDLNSENK